LVSGLIRINARLTIARHDSCAGRPRHRPRRGQSRTDQQREDQRHAGVDGYCDVDVAHQLAGAATKSAAVATQYGSRERRIDELMAVERAYSQKSRQWPAQAGAGSCPRFYMKHSTAAGPSVPPRRMRVSR